MTAIGMIFCSEHCPLQHKALTPFENDFYEIARSLKFTPVQNVFQSQLVKD